MNKENPVYKNIETIIEHVKVNMLAGDGWDDALKGVLAHYGDIQSLLAPGGIPPAQMPVVISESESLHAQEDEHGGDLQEGEVGMEKTFDYEDEDYEESEDFDPVDAQELEAILAPEPEPNQAQEEKKFSIDDLRKKALRISFLLPKMSDEEIQKYKDIYAKATAADGGLFNLYEYLRRESKLFDNSDNPKDRFKLESMENISIESLVNLYLNRPDFHPHIRTRIEGYFTDIGPQPLPPMTPIFAKQLAHRFAKSRWSAEEFQILCDEDSTLRKCVQYWCLESYKSVINGMPYAEAEMNDPAEFNDNISEWFNWKEYKARVKRKSNKQNDDDYAEHLFDRFRASRYKATIDLNGVDEKLIGMLERFPNFKSVISFVRTQVRLSAIKGTFRMPPILLEGPAGIGKTQFATELGQALGSLFVHVDISTTTESWVLAGLRSSWNGARAGKVTEALIDSPNLSPVILLDELDKVPNSDKDPRRALYQLLEENTASNFVDEFLEFPINASQVVFIASANSLDGIAQPLLTRFKVFELQEPKPEERRAIISNIYSSITKPLSVFESIIPDDVLDSLLPYSFREAKNFISEAVGIVMLDYSIDELKGMKEQEALKLQVSDIPLPRQKQNSIGF
nr:AAA family ATPase [Achromobacter ruhlandii]